jgi:peptide/nickel transport system ATP-binding protein
MTPPDQPLLDVQGLSVCYRTPNGPRRAVHGVDLRVAAGETVAVVGESGSGKSTLAHALIGLLPAGGYREAGSIRFGGADLAALSERELRALRGSGIGFIPQDPSASLNPVRRVGHQIAEVVRIHGRTDRASAAARAVELLDQAGVADPSLRAGQYPHELSGGLRQRALIAIALAAAPRLIVADEPTSALDVTVQRRILDHLEQLARETGTALLLITHDLGVAADRAHRVVVMSGGAVVESGTARQVLLEPVHSYSRRLVASAPSLTTRPLVTIPDAGRRTDGESGVESGGESGGESGADLLVADRLVHDYPSPGRRSGAGRRAVDEVSFRIGRGETFALVGESGSGKTTIARTVGRLLDPTGGRVLFDGADITAVRGAGLRALRRRIQFIQQNPYTSLDPRQSVEQIVAEPLRAFRLGDRRERAARVRALLEQVALPAALLRRRPAELSGGQRQRVAIARALVLRPDLVVCDEPVSALDASVQAQILALLAALQRELGVSYLFISHDLAVVRQIAHRTGVLRAGRLIEAGDTQEILTSPSDPYTKELIDAIPGTRALSD